MGDVERRRIVKRREPEKVSKDKKYLCPACHGQVTVAGKKDIASVKDVHDRTCPAVLRVKR